MRNNSQWRTRSTLSPYLKTEIVILLKVVSEKLQQVPWNIKHETGNQQNCLLAAVGVREPVHVHDCNVLLIKRSKTFFATGTIFKTYDNNEAAMSFGEYGFNCHALHRNFVFVILDPNPICGWYFSGLSRSILEAGFGLDCVNAQFEGLDLRLSENWVGPAGVKWAASRNQVCM